MPVLLDYIHPASLQIPIIKDYVRRSGLLQTATFNEANDGMKHDYEYVDELPTAVVGALNTAVNASVEKSRELTVKLLPLRVKAFYDSLIVDAKGGYDVYFARKMDMFMRALLNKLVDSVYYGSSSFGDSSFGMGLHQYAKAFGNVTQLSGSSGSRSSLFCVHYQDQQTALLTPPSSAFASDISTGVITDKEDIIRISSLSNKFKYDNNGISGYGMEFLLPAALLVGSKYGVATITQIDSTHKPTAVQIDDMIAKVDGSADGMTFIYGNDTALNTIKALRASQYMNNADTNFNTQVSSWNGIPIVREVRLSSAETTVLD